MNILKNTKAFVITDLMETQYFKEEYPWGHFNLTSHIEQANQFTTWDQASKVVERMSRDNPVHYILPITILITGDE